MFRAPSKQSAPAAESAPPALVPLRAFVNRSLVGLFALSVLALALAYQFPFEQSELSQPAIVLSGLYDLEGRTSARPYRWTSEHAALWLPGVGRQPYRLTLALASGRPDNADLPEVSVWAGGTRLAQFTLPRPPGDYVWDVPAEAISWSGNLELRIDAETFVPPSDLRPLGMILYGIRLESRRELFGTVMPAVAPVAWGALALCLLFLALRARGVPLRLAWGIALVGLAAACAGFAFAHLATVAALPWVVLAASLAFVLTHRD